MIKILSSGTLLIAFIYIVYVTIFYFLQRSMLFPVQYLPKHDASLIDKAGGEIVRLDFSQGQFELAYLPSASAEQKPNEASPVIILAHGNGNVMDDWAGRMDFMREQGYAVVLVEYPGYGRSDGSPSYDSIKETMALTYSWVEDNEELDNQQIVLVGRSMGGGAVLTLIPEKQPQAVILMSTYSSIEDLASARLLPRFFVRDPFDNVKALSQYAGKTYLVHGKKDKTVPFDSFEKLQVVAKNSQTKIYQGGHSDSPDDWPAFWSELNLFLKN